MKLLSGGGAWLKGDNVQKGEAVTFKDAGTVQMSDRYKYEDGTPQKQLVFKVDFKGEDRQLRVNFQSRINLIEAWGDETELWVGKKARINLVPTPQGKKSIVLEADLDEWKQ